MARPATMDEAVALAGRVVAAAGGVVVTAYALDHLAAVSGGEAAALARGLEALRGAGVGLVAEAPAESPICRVAQRRPRGGARGGPSGGA